MTPLKPRRRATSPAKPARPDVALVRTPTQERSRERLNAILDAAKEIILESGVAGLKIQDIAARAGVTAGSMYQYFPNKAAIVQSIAERYAETMAADTAGKLGPRPESLADCVEIVRSGLGRVAAKGHDDPVMQDVMMGLEVDKSMSDLLLRVRRLWADATLNHIKHLFPQRRHQDLGRQLTLIAHLGDSVLRLAFSASPKERKQYLAMAQAMITESMFEQYRT